MPTTKFENNLVLCGCFVFEIVLFYFFLYVAPNFKTFYRLANGQKPPIEKPMQISKK